MIFSSMMILLLTSGLFDFSLGAFRQCATIDSQQGIDSCGYQHLPCEAGYVVQNDESGCFAECVMCGNFTYTEGSTNCTECLPCEDCTEDTEEFEICAPQCFHVTCLPLPEIQNGYYNCTNENLLGSTCRVVCDDGFIPGYLYATCLSDRTWNGGTPFCKATCPPLQKVPNGQYVCTNYRFLHSQCWIDCDVGYQTSVGHYLTCQEDKMWDGDVGHCRATEVTHPLTLIVLIAAVAVCVIAVIFVYMNKKKKSQCCREYEEAPQDDPSRRDVVMEVPL